MTSSRVRQRSLEEEASGRWWKPRRSDHPSHYLSSPGSTRVHHVGVGFELTEQVARTCLRQRVQPRLQKEAADHAADPVAHLSPSLFRCIGGCASRTPIGARAVLRRKLHDSPLSQPRSFFISRFSAKGASVGGVGRADRGCYGVPADGMM